MACSVQLCLNGRIGSKSGLVILGVLTMQLIPPSSERKSSRTSAVNKAFGLSQASTQNIDSLIHNPNNMCNFHAEGFIFGLRVCQIATKRLRFGKIHYHYLQTAALGVRALALLENIKDIFVCPKHFSIKALLAIILNVHW